MEQMVAIPVNPDKNPRKRREKMTRGLAQVPLVPL